MEYMFANCTSLTELDVHSFCTQKVQTMENMFSGCSSLKNLDLTNFDFAMQPIMVHMFWDSNALISLKLPEDMRQSILLPSTEGYVWKDENGIKRTATVKRHKSAMSYTKYKEQEDKQPSETPVPTQKPTASPSAVPSAIPSVAPSTKPSAVPSAAPSAAPSTKPSAEPTPSAQPSATPSVRPAASVGTVLKEKSGRTYKITEVSDGSSKPEVTFTALSKKDKKAKKVKIPKTVTIDKVTYEVTQVAPKAFKNSKKLESISLPQTITVFGNSSFEGCKKLKSVTIGKNVTSVGKNTFKNCKALKTITFKSTKVVEIDKTAFKGVNKSCVVRVPKKLLKKYQKIFKKNKIKLKLKSI